MKAKIRQFNAQEIAEYQATHEPHRKVREAWKTDEIETRKREARRALRESQALRYRSIGQ